MNNKVWEETIHYLYNAAPTFQNIGAGAYKEGLANTHALDEHFGHPHQRYRTIHVAGTNGKGSVSSTLAAILQCAGLRVGLYTSPHLVDFRERIHVNGEMIPRERVIDFVRDERAFFEPLAPSFFELTTALAFLWFAEQEVDVAVIEVGLGGRLDCTNIIRPNLSIITNISFDHQQFLGNTLPQIATEKAGIIKPGIPVVVGETSNNTAVRQVFLDAFQEANNLSPTPSPTTSQTLPPVTIRFADEEHWIASSEPAPNGGLLININDIYGFCLPITQPLNFSLGGLYQLHNVATILCAVSTLLQQPFYAKAFATHPDAVCEGMANVQKLTGLRGRWQRIHEHPAAVCDAGHNVAGIEYVARQLAMQHCRLHIVFGMVDDKDAAGALSLLPADATYYFTQPSTKRALPATQLAALAESLGRQGTTYTTVADAYAAALTTAHPTDFIFIGGSCYVVADLLNSIQDKN